MNYTIKAGHHRPKGWLWRIRPHFGIRSRTWRVKFDESCHYDWKAKPELDAWNKLLGWTNWNGKHSIRVGWRPFEEELKYTQYDLTAMPYGERSKPIEGSSPRKKVWLGAYLKENGKRTTHPPEMSLGYWDYGEELTVKIWHQEYANNVCIKVIGEREESYWEWEFTKPTRPGWLSRPYFGGRAKAPHDMKIEIEKV